MSDLISREDAIALVIKAIYGTDNKEIQEYLFDGLRKQMWSLPSAEPKTGEWINRSLNIRYPEWERYTCSECGKHSYSYDYCPNCGADMRGEEE